MIIKLNDKHLSLFICLFLTVITLSVFLQVKDHDFVYFDDNKYITDNRHVQSGLTSGNITWAFTTFHAGNWHPLTWISHMLDCQLFGLKPGLHHLVNLFFHMANTLLLFFVLHRMTKGLWQSAFVAAVFAIHPLHVESVAWVSERKDVLSTFFWMLTMGAYAVYVERRELKRYLLTLFFFALGLMAKPMLVTLPFVLLLLDYWPLRRLTIGKSSVIEHTQSEKSLNTRRRKKERQRSAIKAEHVNKTEKQTRQRPAIGHIILEKVPFFVLSLASSIITYMAQQKGGAVGSLQSFPLSARMANALVSYCGYIGKMIWPENLAVLYPHHGMLPTWQVIGAVFFLGITTFLIIRNVKRFPYLTTGWLWYLGTLVPVIGLVQVGVQAMADRYTYLPIIGLFIAIAWIVPDLLARWRFHRIALTVLVTCVIAALITVALFQIRYWQNSMTLFARALNVTKNNFVIETNMGASLAEQGRFGEAIAHYQEALRINPNYAAAHYNLGTDLLSRGKLDEAIYHFRESIRIKPEHDNAQYNLGLASMRKGNIDEAMSYFHQANRIDPFDPETILNMGVITAMHGNLDNAMDYFVKALQIKPDYAEAHANLGLTLMQKGNLDDAISHLREAIRLMPSNPENYFALGKILAKKGNLDEALADYSRALQIKPGYAEIHNNMGIILARQGKLDEAIAHFRQALQIRPDYKEAHSNLQVALAQWRKTQ